VTPDFVQEQHRVAARTRELFGTLNPNVHRASGRLQLPENTPVAMVVFGTWTFVVNFIGTSLFFYELRQLFWAESHGFSGRNRAKIRTHLHKRF
jgi:hypothetical protein